jgi:hypothetical protein
MNARNLLALSALVASFPFAAQAGEPSGVARFECQDYTRPSMQVMRDDFGIYNLDQAYDARTKVHLIVQRACARGPQFVEVAWEKRSAEQSFRLVAAK